VSSVIFAPFGLLCVHWRVPGGPHGGGRIKKGPGGPLSVQGGRFMLGSRSNPVQDGKRIRRAASLNDGPQTASSHTLTWFARGVLHGLGKAHKDAHCHGRNRFSLHFCLRPLFHISVAHRKT